MQLLIELTRKKISRGAKVAGGLRTADLPFPVGDICLGDKCDCSGNLYLTDGIKICGGYLLLIVVDLTPSGNGHFHIRLTAADPYLSYHHIVEGLVALCSGDGHLIRPSRRHRVQSKGPLPLLVRLDSPGLSIETNNDLFAGRCPSPDGNGLVTL